MKVRFVVFLLLLAWTAMVLVPGLSGAAEKVKIGIALKTHAVFVMPMLAAQEKGFWKQQGLDAEWLSFRGGAAMGQAAAGKAIHMGMTGVAGTVRAITRKLPVTIVYHPGVANDFGIWVLTNSPIKKPADLRGKKIDVTRRGGTSYSYATAVAKTLGFGKDIRLTAAGGIRAQLAALKSGAIDAGMITFFAIAPLAVRGEVREILHMVDILPKPWMSRVVYSRKDFLAKNPDSVGKMVKSLLQATKFVMKNRDWTIGKMKSYSKYPAKAAEVLYPKLIYSKDGRIDPKALSNVRQFLLDYKVISAADAIPTKEMYTNRFTD